jgi:hypothetical protein
MAGPAPLLELVKLDVIERQARFFAKTSVAWPKNV